jgi:hypothetical protein
VVVLATAEGVCVGVRLVVVVRGCLTVAAGSWQPDSLTTVVGVDMLDKASKARCCGVCVVLLSPQLIN